MACENKPFRYHRSHIPPREVRMKREEYKQNIAICMERIASLPASEIKYHLARLIHCLQETNNDFSRKFLNDSLDLVAALNEVMGVGLTSQKMVRQAYAKVMLKYRRLCHLAALDRIHNKIVHYLLLLGSSLVAFISGTLGGLIGSFAGLARGIWNLDNPFSSFALGLTAGILLGGIIGFRLPQKLLNNELIKQLRLCLEGIDECITLLKEGRIQPFSYYREQVKTKLLEDYFAKDMDAFEEFLQRTDVNYEVCTMYAQFLSPRFERFLGHHAFIKINLQVDREPMFIEFSTGKPNLERPITQQESRVVSGEMIVDMLALHEQLQVNHACTATYIITKMKPGEVDCFSYLNTILMGSSQTPVAVKRFNGRENWIGRNVIGFFMQKLNSFEEDNVEFKATAGLATTA
ncbi:hypothetical protein EAW55_01900 [Legionella jordanis]|nr:hypothetical protein EAW55_01900 [Legionella jordanis]